MDSKMYVYTIKQDVTKPTVWYFTLHPDSTSNAQVLQIKVNADVGRFTLRKSANLNLKIVSDCIVKFLELLRTEYNVK